MNKAITITSNGQADTADFTIRLNRPIDLQGLKWNISLNQLITYNSWWNISDELGNTTFKYNNGTVDRTLNLEPGNYSFSALVDHIHDKMVALGDYTLVNGDPVFSINFEMDISDGYVSLILTDSYTVDFTNLNIRNIFGFASQVYNASTVAPNKANIRYGVDFILLHLNIVGGNSIFNGRDSDVIYSFGVNVDSNEVISIEPNNSLSIGVNLFGQIEEMRLYLTDQDNRKINLRGAPLKAVFSLIPQL